MQAPRNAATAEVESEYGWRDRLGICLSVLCLVHCLMTPLILGLVPVGAALGFWQHGFHQVFLLVVPVVALIAFVPGWKLHRDSRVWYWGGSGIVLLALGVAAGEIVGHEAVTDLTLTAWTLKAWSSVAVELALTLAGGACLIRAHLLNRELCVCCQEDHAHKQQHDGLHDHSGHKHA